MGWIVVPDRVNVRIRVRVRVIGLAVSEWLAARRAPS